jgi:hypothetical protein
MLGMPVLYETNTGLRFQCFRLPWRSQDKLREQSAWNLPENFIVPAHFTIVISTNGRNLPFFDEQRGAETKRISPVGRNDRLGGINLVFG